MSLSNGISLPNAIANGDTTDASLMMADLNTLLAGLNRALLDSGSGNGMNAQSTQIHNVSDPSAAQDAATQNYVVNQLAAYATTAALNAAVAPLATTAAMNAAISSAIAPLAPLASPVFTGAPLAPTAAAGTNTTQVASTAFVQAAALGVGQAWADFTASRSVGTLYTNTTGRMIMVSVATGSSSAATTYQAEVGGVPVAMVYPNVGASDIRIGPSFMVPPGATYMIRVTAGSIAIAQWSELR